MSSSFTQAAVERIAQCAGAMARNDASAAQAVWADYDANTEHWYGFDPYGTKVDDVEFFELAFGKSSSPVARQLHTFAELLELAVVAGYVDLAGMQERDRLREALQRFCEGEQNGTVDLTLVQDLLARLGGRSAARVPMRNNAAFQAFAAYLRLDEQTRQDAHFVQFISTSNAVWQPGHDLGFLVSPRHFAEALVTGRIGQLEAGDAAGGLRAMEYLAALHGFIQRSASCPELCDKVLRQARWSHRMDVIEHRLRLWSERMSEWPGAEPGEGHEAAFASLDELAQRLRSLGLVAELPAEVSVVIAPTAEQLLAVGRSGAAIKALQDSLYYLDRDLADTASTRWHERLADYVAACLQLAELGQVDLAAAWLARVEPHLAAGSPYIESKRAVAVLAEARRSQPALPTAPDAEGQAEPPPTYKPVQASRGNPPRAGKSREA